jgi:soluble lytic murein transglycosylase-like protein
MARRVGGAQPSVRRRAASVSHRADQGAYSLTGCAPKASRNPRVKPNSGGCGIPVALPGPTCIGQSRLAYAMNTMSEPMTTPTINDDRPRRQVLGLAVLLLTLGAGYGVAQVAAPPPAELVELEESEAVDEERRLSVAEIMAEIETVAARHRVPPRLVAAIVAVESEFNPRAVSRKGAQGLMQLMPATAASVSVQDSFDARENIEGGVRHLRALMDRYHNDLPVVLAAYNAGDRAVLTHQGVPPYRETRQYVIRVLRRYDRDAAKAAAQRIYGTKAPARPAPTMVKARLVSYEGTVPAVVRYRYQGDLLGEHEPAGPVETAPPRRTENP